MCGSSSSAWLPFHCLLSFLVTEEKYTFYILVFNLSGFATSMDFKRSGSSCRSHGCYRRCTKLCPPLFCFFSQALNHQKTKLQTFQDPFCMYVVANVQWRCRKVSLTIIYLQHRNLTHFWSEAFSHTIRVSLSVVWKPLIYYCCGVAIQPFILQL